MSLVAVAVVVGLVLLVMHLYDRQHLSSGERGVAIRLVYQADAVPGDADHETARFEVWKRGALELLREAHLAERTARDRKVSGLLDQLYYTSEAGASLCCIVEAEGSLSEESVRQNKGVVRMRDEAKCRSFRVRDALSRELEIGRVGLGQMSDSDYQSVLSSCS